MSINDGSNSIDHSDTKIAENLESTEQSANNHQWFIVYVLSGYENRVLKTLKERILNHGMTDSFSEIVVPEEDVVQNVNGKKRTVKKKFFPGYVLIKMEMNNETWQLVKNTDKITDFVGGTRGKPTPISDQEALVMLGRAESEQQVRRSSSNYSEGDSVRVIEGPFASFIGTVESVSQNGKLKVNVSIFGRPTPVELDEAQVEIEKN